MLWQGRFGTVFERVKVVPYKTRKLDVDNPVTTEKGLLLLIVISAVYLVAYLFPSLIY